MRSKHCSKWLISPAAGICLPLVPGLCPVLHLRHFLPVADDHHQQLSRAPTDIIWVWWCSYSPDSLTCSQQLIWTPCALTSLGLAPLWLVKQRATAADANSWARQWQMLLVTSLLFLGQWGPPWLCSPVCHVHMQEQWKSGKLHVYVRRCLTTNSWAFRKAVRSIAFSFFSVPAQSSDLILLSKLFNAWEL